MRLNVFKRPEAVHNCDAMVFCVLLTGEYVDKKEFNNKVKNESLVTLPPVTSN